MIRLLRIVIQCLLVLLLVSVAVAIGATETGAAEKVVLGVVAGLLAYVAVWVRRLGSGHSRAQDRAATAVFAARRAPATPASAAGPRSTSPSSRPAGSSARSGARSRARARWRAGRVRSRSTRRVRTRGRSGGGTTPARREALLAALDLLRELGDHDGVQVGAFGRSHASTIRLLSRLGRPLAES